jgi:hypothetical protein
MLNSRLLAPLCFIALLVGAVVFAPMGGQALWLRTLHNFAHVPIFGCIAVAGAIALRAWPAAAKFGSWASYLTGFAIAGLLGLATEIAQSFTGRDASWMDLANDLLGAIAFLGVFAVVDNRLRTGVRRIALFGGLLVFAIASIPLVNMALAYAQRSWGFPVVAEFERALGTAFISTRHAKIAVEPLPQPWGDGAQRALRIDFYEDPWPGIEFTEPPPDWRGYATLRLEAFNPTHQRLDFTVRIDDFEHNGREADRFNRLFTLEPFTHSTFVIPLHDIEHAPKERRFDLARVRRIIVFRSRPSQAPTMYLGRVALER